MLLFSQGPLKLSCVIYFYLDVFKPLFLCLKEEYIQVFENVNTTLFGPNINNGKHTILKEILL